MTDNSSIDTQALLREAQDIRVKAFLHGEEQDRTDAQLGVELAGILHTFALHKELRSAEKSTHTYESRLERLSAIRSRAGLCFPLNRKYHQWLDLVDITRQNLEDARTRERLICVERANTHRSIEPPTYRADEHTR